MFQHYAVSSYALTYLCTSDSCRICMGQSLLTTLLPAQEGKRREGRGVREEGGGKRRREGRRVGEVARSDGALTLFCQGFYPIPLHYLHEATCTSTYLHRPTQTYRHLRTPTYTYIHLCTPTYTHTPTCTYTTYTYLRLHTHTSPTYTCTHQHTPA